MNVKKIISNFLLAVMLVSCSYYFLDKRIALFVQKVLMSNLNVFSSNIPDLLFFIVCAITGLAWTVYFSLAHKGIFNTQTRFSHLVAVTVPLTFVLKAALKLAVGRLDTRYWVRYPGSKAFHWFHGVGNYASFPSGHMAVFTVFFVAAAQFYPRYRYACYSLLAALALALIATNYHFLSDVIAGAYLGYLVDYVARHGLNLRGAVDRSQE